MRSHCGPKSCLIMTSINPTGGNPEFIGGDMIMKHAFSSMENIGFSESQVMEMGQHVFEISVIGFIAAESMFHDHVPANFGGDHLSYRI